jgi:Bacterial SH3 domain
MKLAALLLVVPVFAQAQGASTVRVTRTAAVVEQADGGAVAVGTVNPGEVLEVLDERGGWLLVRPPAGSTQTWRTGWVNAANVQAMRAATQVASAPPLGTDSTPPGGRKGFVIGLGGGVGLHHSTTPTTVFRGVTFGGETTNSFGLATNFLIGYAPTDRLLVYYQNAVQFSSSSTYDLVGLTGGGATYALKAGARSWYISGAIGGGIGAEVDFDSGSVDSVERGLAFDIGGGYEFARHWFLGGTVMFVKLDGTTQTVYRGTITWIFY